MSDQKKIDELLHALRQSKEFDGELVDQLEKALIAGDGAPKELLIKLLGDTLPAIRVAAIDACRGRKENELFTALIRVVADTDAQVKVKLATILPELPFKRFEKTYEKLLEDSEAEVRLAAAKAAQGKQELYYLVRDLLRSDPHKTVRIGAAYSLNSFKLKDLDILNDLLASIAVDADEEVRTCCANLVERQLATAAENESFLSTDFDFIQKVRQNLENIEQSFPSLEAWFSRYTIKKVDQEELAKYGTDLTTLAEAGTLPRAYGTEAVKETVLKMLSREGPRAIVFLGKTGVGKSAVINELVYELLKEENGAWRVLRISPTEFMSGTKYLGEWESRVNNLIKTVRTPCRVIIYVPNFGELSGMGQWSQSQSNVATALAPHIEDGSIVVIGESTQEAYSAGVGKFPVVSRLFAKLLIEPASETLTREILGAVRDENHSDVSDKVLDNIVEISDQYLNHSERPGSAVSLLRDVIASTSASGTAITPRTILDVVSNSTGLPADLLDDSIPLDLSAVRGFFEKRIMGQPDAVDAVVDLLMLIKAGLTDQNKPLGIFLFIGPTGVGKTELARALAEYVFGDTARLLRFDMSEFASYEGFERLIGTSGPGLLTETVRAKPFSVLLLDEIEKGHTNVFDLCLQLFDAGRLTDGQGRTVDFRRTIIILTSNIGAANKSDVILGFESANQQRSSDTANKERTFRELSRAFRPEFLNRIDRIVNFRPLSLEVAESIARREIDVVLKRSGITRRNLSVDIDPTVIGALLKEGYSQSFGARPLKRAVEKMLLLPLAKAISTGRISGQMVLRLTASSPDKIDVKIISAVEKPKAPPAVRSNNSLVDLSQDLVDGIGALEDHIIPMSERKSELLHEIHKPEFYQNHEVKTSTFDEIHKLDQFLATYEGLCKVVYGIHDRLNRPVARNEEPALLERLSQLGSELDHLRSIALCDDSKDLGDALICVKRVDDSAKSIGGIESIVKIYLAFGKRRRLTVDVIAELIDDSNEIVYIHAVGLGAYALFKNEIGVHQFENRVKSRDPRNGKEKQHFDREVVRVDVLSVGKPATNTFLAKVKQTISRSKTKTGQFLKNPTFDIALFHEPSIRSFQGLLNGEKEEALGSAQLILNSIIEDQESAKIDSIVRYYDFGSGAKIKDTRTGRTTGKIDQILKGNLDLFSHQMSID